MDAGPENKVLSVRFSLRYKLLIGFFLLFAAVFAGAFYWFYRYSTDTALQSIQDDLISTLRGTQSGINGDEFIALVREGVPDESGVPAQDERYQRHQDWLVRVNSVEPRAINTYTYIKGDEPDEVQWVGDNYRQSQPDNSTKFLESYIRTPDSFILEGFERETVSMEGYHDDWGYHVSAYGPIIDSQGKVVGAVGIDFLANYVEQVQAGIRQTMTWALGIAAIVLFALVFGMSRVLTQPIVRLTRAAQGVGEGNYEQDFSALTQDRFPDEIDVLASNFAAMVDKVYQREQKLKQQVEELKIEIDEAKRSSQVSEIVDTDFFRDLQAKASRMRNRRGQQEESPAD